MGNLRAALQELEHRAKENEIERHELRNAFESSQAYIEGLEQDVHDIQQQVAHFQLANPQFRILGHDVLTKSKAARLTMQVASKAIHSLHKQQHFVSTINTREKGTLTLLAGLDYHFDLKYMLLKIPTVDVETQVQEETNSVQIQTLHSNKEQVKMDQKLVQVDLRPHSSKKPVSGRGTSRSKSRESPSKSVIAEREELKRKREERRQNWEQKQTRVSSAFRATMDTLDQETKGHLPVGVITSETERTLSEGEICSEKRQPIKLETMFWDVFGSMLQDSHMMRVQAKYRRIMKYGKGSYRRSKSDSRLIPAKIKELRTVLDEVSQEELQEIIKKGAQLTNANVQRYYEKEKLYPKIKVMLSPERRLIQADNHDQEVEEETSPPAFLTGLGLADEESKAIVSRSRKHSPDQEFRTQALVPRQNRSVLHRRPVFRVVPFGIEYIDKLLERQYAKQCDREIQTEKQGEDEKSEGSRKMFYSRRGSALRKLSEISKQLARRSASSEKNSEDRQSSPTTSRPLKTIFKKLKRGKRNQQQLLEQMSGDSSIITAPRLAPPSAGSSKTNLNDNPSSEYYNTKTKKIKQFSSKRRQIVQHSTPTTPRRQAYQNITISNFVMNIHPPPPSSISQQNSRRNLRAQQLLEVIPTEASIDQRPYTSKPTQREQSQSVSDWNPVDLSHVSSFTIEPKQPDARENRLRFNYQINKSMRAKFRMKRASINF